MDVLAEQDIMESTNRPTHSGNSQEGTKHGVLLPNQKLPYELLVILFSYLPVIPHLLTVQRVCTAWKVAARDKHLWKCYTLRSERLDKFKNFIKLMPGLKNINGYAQNRLLYTILKHVRELERLNCKFEPPLSASQVEIIFNWYPKLLSINLCLFAPDILKSVEMLKTNRDLKEVVFYSPDKCDIKYMIPSTVISVFNIFNDEQNFSALESLSLSMCQFLYPIRYSNVWNAITNTIKKKSQQLLKLHIELINVAVDTANAINMCSNLRYLSVELRTEGAPIDIRVHTMSRLEYLKIVMYEEKPYFIEVLNNSLYNCSWEHLTEVYFKVKSEKFRTFQALIANAKQLRKLHYMDMTLSVCNSELEQLSSLSNLVDLYVAGFRTISEDGMKHVSMCRNLQRLDLYGLNSNIGISEVGGGVKSFEEGDSSVVSSLDTHPLTVEESAISSKIMDGEKNDRQKLNKVNREVVSPNQKLPYELLLILFSYLPIPDLVSLQRVCSGWRAAAQDKSLWKNYELCIHTEFLGVRNEKEVRTMPALRNINGHAENDFLNVILESVNELTKMNIDFVPPISSSQVQSVIEKYPELEIMCLDLCASDVLESVEILKTSAYIKEVMFHNNHCRDPCVCCSPSKLLNIFNVFADICNFPALKEIDLRFLPFEEAFKDKAFRNVLTNVIETRSHRLLSLNLSLSHPDNSGILNAISECTKLQTLDLRLCKNCPNNINIVRMPALQSLFLWLHNSDYPNTLYDSFNMGSWTNLTKVTFNMDTADKFKGGILKTIIKKVKLLRELSYYDGSCNTNENELVQVGTLSNLTSLCVSGLQNISEAGISYILNCSNMEWLTCEANVSTIVNLKDYIRNEVRKFVKLELFTLFIPDLVNIRLRNMEEVKRFVS